ncbi:MAG: peptidase M16 [Lysobacteraceae bacterium]|nr:MAG: peptidase M16 [Xanthomonadaceae bacterium]
MHLNAMRSVALGSTLLFSAAQATEIDISYEKFVLDNGLTLIVHEDNKTPIVAVNVWYHVGSKNEKQGKTGFAHLFEHLMFNGSENYNDDYFKPFDRVGATGMNGTTNFDRTNYFQEVPKNALDMALWMESDRMGHLLGVIDQARLDEQRGVVQNEKRQGENQPYGRVFTDAFKNIFPANHPYSWPVIGYMDDLEAASLEDVKGWFEQYYGAANATIVLSGDIDPETALAKVEQYFGHIAAGPPLTKQDVWVPELTGKHTMVMQDRVPQARVYKIYMMPEIGNPQSTLLDLASGVLSEGKSSRLYKRLVHDLQIASDVNAFAFPLEISGLFGVIATALPGQDLDEIDRIIDEEVAKFVKEGPTREELARVKTNRKASFLRGLERVGGFGGKSDILARGQVYLDNPGAYQTTLDERESASTRDVKEAAADWLMRGQYVMKVVPFEDYAVSESDVDRSQIPAPTAPPEVSFDSFERDTLSNGLQLILARRDALPLVDMRLMVNAGYAADAYAAAGVANITLNMMDEGTTKRDALAISDELSELGATLSTGSNLDVSEVRMNALKENLEPSLDLFADVLLNPAFPETDFEALKKRQLAAIEQEKVTPVSMALRVFPKLLYGEGHAYSLPFTGSGTTETVSAMTTDDLKAFHEAWFKPNNATMVIVGDVTMDEIKPLLERKLRSWKSGEVQQKNIGLVGDKSASKVFIVDRPDSEQSVILAGNLAPGKATPNDLAIEAMNEVLGGSFNARLNMNLREDKHWSYGARTFIIDAQGQRPFLAYAPVQTDKTGESMAEIVSEINAIGGERPPTDEEVQRAKDKNTLTLAGRWETAGAVSGSLADMVRYGLPDDYWQTYPDKVRGLSDEEIAEASDIIKPNGMVWIVVGDRAKIEGKIAELELGEIQYLDADGNMLSN